MKLGVSSEYTSCLTLSQHFYKK